MGEKLDPLAGWMGLRGTYRGPENVAKKIIFSWK